MGVELRLQQAPRWIANPQTGLALGSATLAWGLAIAAFTDIERLASLLFVAGVPGVASVGLGEWGRRLARRNGQSVAATHVAQWIGTVPSLPLILFGGICVIALGPLALGPLALLGLLVVVVVLVRSARASD